MKAVIIEDETAAVSSLKAILRHNSVVGIEVVAELESIEDSIEWFRSSSQPDIILWIFIWQTDWPSKSLKSRYSGSCGIYYCL